MTPTLNPDPMVWSQTRSTFVFSKHVQNFSFKIAKRVRLISRVLSRYITTTPLTSLSALQATFLSLTLNDNLFPCLFCHRVEDSSEPMLTTSVLLRVVTTLSLNGMNRYWYQRLEQHFHCVFFFHKYFSCIKQHKIDVKLRIHISDCYYISHLICW